MTGRLRDIYATHPMVMEAADKIERLEKLNYATDDTNRALLAEVERLKATNESLEREMKIVRGARGDPKDRAEIAGLRAEIEQWYDAVKLYMRTGSTGKMHELVVARAK